MQPQTRMQLTGLTPARTTPMINCSVVVPEPIDTSPIRSPQAVHTVLAHHFRGRSVVEIGTRNGDGMACFSRVASHATAVEMSREYCEKLRARAAGAFDVSCKSYQAGLPDADVYTWWQQWPTLTNHRLLDHLARRHREGAIRASAEAIFVVDMLWSYDRRSWKKLQALAAWSKRVPYDEAAACRARSKGEQSSKQLKLCTRAKGEFLVVGMPLRTVAASELFTARTASAKGRSSSGVGRRLFARTRVFL